MLQQWGGRQLILELPPVETTAHVAGGLLGRRVGSREHGEEEGREYVSGKPRVALSPSKTQVFTERKGAVNIHRLQRSS